MTLTHRTERLNDLIRAELSELLRRKVKDPRVASVSVTAVATTPDVSQAKVMVSLLEPAAEPPKAEAALAGLSRAAGFLRGELGRRLRLKKAPELRFEIDHAVQESARLDHLLEALEQERQP